MTLFLFLLKTYLVIGILWAIFACIRTIIKRGSQFPIWNYPIFFVVDTLFWPLTIFLMFADGS